LLFNAGGEKSLYGKLYPYFLDYISERFWLLDPALKLLFNSKWKNSGQGWVPDKVAVQFYRFSLVCSVVAGLEAIVLELWEIS
jgi:hypothetical protein